MLTFGLEVLRAEFEIGLRMRADGANLGRVLAEVDVAAIGTDPHALVAAGEHSAVFEVAQQLIVASLVLLLDLADHLKERGNAGEALFSGFLGELGVHLRSTRSSHRPQRLSGSAQ